MFPREKKLELMKGIMWDYHFPTEECLEVLEGTRGTVGHYNEATLFRKLLESYPWFTIMSILPLQGINELLTEEIIQKLRFKSLKTDYEFVRTRLQKNLRVTGCSNPYRSSSNVLVDNIGNILSNKLTAMLSRDEAKDIFDIISISEKYSFNWKEIYKQAFEKQIMNEQDIAMRFTTFPVEWFEGKSWLKNPVNLNEMKEKLEIIADDFLFARDNSLGVGMEHILKAGVIK
ncbi:MAG: hypothetical protein A3H98_12655 [Bacteroidetes bacterium RIFCSPLOWO2_02_FULL_36_8]|nr:MAG: hypothetical protein A3H98_12655 [Bacteroidetes bacterium RIFCSPLOWO2_02_FULL_36_8]OFY71363.1 MAG: hypothetical protein A3G23_04210 [Bacteroidetes bacterium RIFCSPLOWO2_12_FULL_37_12]